MRVTAVFLADDGRYLEQALSALRAQTRPIDEILVVDLTDKPRNRDLITAFAPDKLSRFSAKANRAESLNNAIDQHRSNSDCYWFLDTQTAPAADALEKLLNALEVSPSLAAAGPKIVNDQGVLIDYGQSITAAGQSVKLVDDELDQGQHDDKSDVMGASAAGLLVRRISFEALNGFDPAFSAYERGLDLCIRIRLSGERVALVPTARVLHVGSGLRKQRARESYVQKRVGQLRRQIVYAGGPKAFLWWLLLVPRGLFWSLLGLFTRKSILKEFWAHLKVALLFIPLIRSRRIAAKVKQNSLKSLSVLMVKKPRSYSIELAGLDFFAKGGLWTVLLCSFLSLGLFWPFIFAPALSGGELLLINPNLGQLWANAAGWNYLGEQLPANPFNLLTALLGSLAFWHPPTAVVLLYFAALPLAALGGWLFAAQLTDKAWVRISAGFFWGFAPPFWAVLTTGNLSGILVHLLLPFFAFLLLAERKTSRTAAGLALLFAAIAAAAPITLLLLALLWLAAVLTSGRHLFKMLLVPLPTAALFAPVLFAGGWQVEVFADAPQQLSNKFIFLGYDARLLGDDFAWPLLALAPLVLLLTLSLLSRVGYLVLLSLALAALGLAAPLLWPLIFSWPSVLSFYWLGVAGAFILALLAVRKAAFLAFLSLAGLLLLLIIPMQNIWLGSSGPAPTEGNLPAYIAAEAQAEPNISTLIIEPLTDQRLEVELVRGGANSYDDKNSLLADRVKHKQEQLAQLAANLITDSGFDVKQAMQKLRIDMVLVKGEQAAASMDMNPFFEAVGKTNYGKLWRFRESEPVETADASSWQLYSLGVYGLLGLLLLYVLLGRSASSRLTPSRRRNKLDTLLLPKGAGGRVGEESWL